MALVRKKDPQWKPSEFKDLEVGQTIEISDYRRLVELGMADLVDEQGNVLPLPGTVFVCGICYEKIASHTGYVEHVMSAHSKDTNFQKPPEEVDEPKETENEEDFSVVKELKKTAEKKAGRPKKNA